MILYCILYISVSYTLRNRRFCDQKMCTHFEIIVALCTIKDLCLYCLFLQLCLPGPDEARPDSGNDPDSLQAASTTHSRSLLRAAPLPPLHLSFLSFLPLSSHTPTSRHGSQNRGRGNNLLGFDRRSRRHPRRLAHCHPLPSHIPIPLRAAAAAARHLRLPQHQFPERRLCLYHRHRRRSHPLSATPFFQIIFLPAAIEHRSRPRGKTVPVDDGPMAQQPPRGHAAEGRHHPACWATERREC